MKDENDIIGIALKDYFNTHSDEVIVVHSPDFDDDEFYSSLYFRDFEDMPDVEKMALKYCKGKVMDIGAGAGSHALHLQNNGFEVIGLDSSHGACEIMQKRGLQNVICADIFNYQASGFDTLLLLMNGIGVCGSIFRLKEFLSMSALFLNKGGQIIFDSSNLSYLFTSEELEEFKTNDYPYYGEIEFQLEYKSIKAKSFWWLYIDYQMLTEIVSLHGFKTELLMEGENLHYLARILL